MYSYPATTSSSATTLSISTDGLSVSVVRHDLKRVMMVMMVNRKEGHNSRMCNGKGYAMYLSVFSSVQLGLECEKGKEKKEKREQVKGKMMLMSMISTLRRREHRTRC